MKEINILEFGAKNYCLFRDKIEIEVKNGLNFIVGPNGVGKTSMLEIPIVTFFGETSKGGRINDVINNKVGKDCYMYTDFEIIDENSVKTKYRCERFGNYKGQGNSAILKRNNEQPYKKGHKEVSEEISNLIAPKKLMMNTILFPQKATGLFLDLTDSERKEIFRKIINLENYPLYQKQASEDEKEINNSIQKSDNDLEVQKQYLNDLQNDMKELENERYKFEENKQNEISRINDEINKLKNELDRLNKSYEKYNIDNLNSEYRRLVQEISNINSELQNLKNQEQSELQNLKYNADSKKSKLNEDFSVHKNQLLNERYQRLEKVNQTTQQSINEHYEAINKLDNDKTRVQQEINSILENVSEKEQWLNSYKSILESDYKYCPECNQEVNDDHINNKIEKLTEEVNSMNKEINNKRNNEISELDKQLEEENNKIEETTKYKDRQINEIDQEINLKIERLNINLNNSISKVDEYLKDYQKQINEKYKNRKIQLQNDLNNKNSELQNIGNEIENYNSLKDKISKLNNQIDLNSQQLKEKENSEFDQNRITNISNKIISVKERIDGLNHQKRRLENELKIVKFWKQGFSNSGIPSMLLDESIPFINKRISHYLDIMSGGRYIVSFDTLKETKGGEFRDKISVNVYDNETWANSKSQLSGGQSRIVDVATILTLSDLQYQIQGIKYNILLFDEVFDSLDSENINYVSRAIREMSNDRSVFVVSHRHFDEVESDQTLTFM